MSSPTLGQFPLSTSVLKLGSHLSSIHKKETYPTLQQSNIAMENGILKMYFLLFSAFSAMLFYQSSSYRLMVLVVWIPGIPWWKELSLRGAPIGIPNPKPPGSKPPIIHYLERQVSYVF